MKVDLVFEGGGVLGITFIGAYQALIDNNFEVARASGTSAGSIVSTLIMAGYNSDELNRILKDTDFKYFMEKTRLSKFGFIGKFLSLFFNDGVCNSECIETWMEKLLRDKGINSFGDIMVNGESPLKIVAADITNRKTLILPDDIAYYGIEPKSFSIAKAVRMSCTIPFYYTPVIINNSGNDKAYIVDGGLISTFPIWIFDIDDKPKRVTFGLKIQDKESLTKAGRKYLIAYSQDIISAAINKDEMTYIREKDRVRTIIIENKEHIKATDFKLTDENIQKLYDQGYEAVSNFLKTWSYPNYIKRFLL